MAQSESASSGTVVSVDGHRLKLTNLDKVLYPETGTTKRDVIEYYAAVADWLIPHAADRACTRKRWVHGVGTDEKPGQMFFQKNLDQGTPSWVKRRAIEHREHDNVYPLVNDRATLTWLAQIAALELHVPQWRFGRTGARRNPDRLVLDLDPGDGAGLPECVEVARLARTILRDVGLDPVPVTSGSKGIHLYAALDGSQTSDQASAFAKELARALEADHPHLVVSDMKKALRGGKVLVDWSQNNGAKTTIVPYSLRGRARPTVAAPRTWRELARKDLRHLEYGEVLERLRRRGDPMADLQGGHLDEDSSLGEYRAKRDPTKTPEPFGDQSDYRAKAHAAAHAMPESEPIFVIHEHHASSLHWDFRLERDGALVSWAVPKGPPADSARNNLAVHVEDHPLDYATFEGDIPKGEYGAGHVDIWDTGTYETEKWRDGKEVIVTLHGDRDPARYALIHTRDEQWLLHLMQPRGEPGSGTRAPSRGADRSAADKLRRSGKTVVGSRKQNVGITPMLATASDEAGIPDDERADWAYEMKWDGVRAVVSIRDGRVDARSRNGLDLTPTFPELAALTDAVHGDAIVDGELVALDPAGRPSFGLLQQRLGLTGERDVASAARRVPARFFVFDLLEHDGDDLTRTPYTERRAALERSVRAAGAVEVPPDAGDDLGAALRTSRKLGLEGVMAKRRDSVYRVGRRSRDWLKLKHQRTQEVVVAGWRPGTGRRASTIGSLLLAVPDDDVLRYVGRVGSGFTERDLEGLRERLERMSRKTSPLEDVPREDAKDAHWITPNLVGEVTYGERTGDGRLRHPVWRGWRTDKSPDEVRWE